MVGSVLGMMTPRETLLWAVQEFRDAADILVDADDQEILNEVIERAEHAVAELKRL